MRTAIIVLTILTAISTAALTQPDIKIGDRAPNFELKDQFGKTWKLPGLADKVTVLVVATSDSGRLMGPWVDSLKSRYSNRITILGLLDLKSIPSIGRGIARSRIKKETKDPMMLDFSGGTARNYGVSPKTPTVVVIDKTGVIRAIAKQAFDKAAFDRVNASIDEALK